MKIIPVYSECIKNIIPGTWYLLPGRLPVFIMTGIDPYKPAVSKCNKYTYRSTWYHGPS